MILFLDDILLITRPQEEKVLTIIGQCHLFLTKDQVSVREISQLIGKMCY